MLQIGFRKAELQFERGLLNKFQLQGNYLDNTDLRLAPNNGVTGSREVKRMLIHNAALVEWCPDDLLDAIPVGSVGCSDRTFSLSVERIS